MKIHNLYKQLRRALLMLLTVSLAAACADDSFTSDVVEEGTPIPAKIIFSVPEAPTETSSRAADEYAVENLYLFVFDVSGNLNLKKNYSLAELQAAPNSYGNLMSENSNYVHLTLPSGKAYIYAFANVNNEIYQGLENRLDNLKVGERCLDALKGIKMEIDAAHRNLQRSGNTLLMSGTCANNEDGTYTIVKDQDIKTLQLKRVDSKITFNIKGGGRCTTFKATNWYIENAPAYSYLVERNPETDSSWDASIGESDFFSTYDENENNLSSIINNSFTFFMPENRKEPEDGITSYADRELQEKLDDGKNGAFLYAPQYATYVVINGTYEGKADSETFGTEKDVFAYVTYKIHLGYVNGLSEEAKSKDFFSKRNVKYTYNVTVNGVDDIVLEVETAGDDNTENSPGATGEVIFTEASKIYNLDAHYEQVLLTFKQEDLKKNKTKLSCLVKTPFTDGEIVDNIDMDWVQVLKNERASTQLQKYPKGGNGLLSVNQMMENLTDNVNNDSYFTNGVVTFTCFVNEFYYESIPTGSKVSPSGPLWKSFVNQPDRKMYMLCHTDVSKDGESSIVSAEYVISQRAIQTFYNYADKNLTGLTTAYGVETINETGWLEWGDVQPGTSPDYGWENMKGMIVATKWDQIVDISNNGYLTLDKNQKVNKTMDDEYMLQTLDKDAYSKAEYYLNGMNDSYRKAYIACMQRNRDNDGKGDINDDEIRWYLPAINQYKAMYIGEAGLGNAKLYYYPATYDAEKNLKHYVSNTAFGGADGGTSPTIHWAEEGTSYSGLKQRIDWGNNNKLNPQGWNGWTTATVHYRCVRNLGTVKERYNNYIVDAPTGTTGVVTINPKYINKDRNSVRSSVLGELGRHTYKPGDENVDNRLYGKFQVNMNVHPSSNLGKAITVVSTVYEYTERTQVETQRKSSKKGSWGTSTYSVWKTTTKVSENQPNEGTNYSGWTESDWTGGSYSGYNSKRTRTITEISNVQQQETYTTATGCETLTNESGKPKWRAPNLREFTLMGIYGLLSDHDVCRTRMGYDNYRKGWYWQSPRISMDGNDYKWGTNIRCVRDVIE